MPVQTMSPSSPAPVQQIPPPSQNKYKTGLFSMLSVLITTGHALVNVYPGFGAGLISSGVGFHIALWGPIPSEPCSINKVTAAALLSLGTATTVGTIYGSRCATELVGPSLGIPLSLIGGFVSSCVYGGDLLYKIFRKEPPQVIPLNPPL